MCTETTSSKIAANRRITLYELDRMKRVVTMRPLPLNTEKFVKNSLSCDRMNCDRMKRAIINGPSDTPPEGPDFNRSKETMSCQDL
mmetsp:Transcript_39444/g.53565  ORF Transcript_39444/g.53565 Transcript_39444/m.53565 type:complete len:86 (-) Transcript_39444:15-272(-)